MRRAVTAAREEKRRDNPQVDPRDDGVLTALAGMPRPASALPKRIASLLEVKTANKSLIFFLLSHRHS